MNNDLPFTYAVVCGDETLAVVPYKAIAEDWSFISKCKVVPLYDHPQPTLIDEEREAVEYFAAFQWTMVKPHATKQQVLERLV